MIDVFKSALVGQFGAALSTLREAVVQCPEHHWATRVGDYPFWQVAYHTLFCADMYLSRDEASFQPRSYHRENYQFLGHLPWPPHEPVVTDVPIARADILDYIEHCRRKADDMVEAETAESLAGPPGFWWYKIPRGEFHLNNVRHIQHHAAQMSLCLRRAEGIDIGWVATG
jgi:hypothetical protein